MEANRTHFVQPGKIEIDANERAVTENSQCCFFVCTIFNSFLNDLLRCCKIWNQERIRMINNLTNVARILPPLQGHH